MKTLKEMYNELLNEAHHDNSRIIAMAKSKNPSEIKKLKSVLLNAEWTEQEISKALKKRKEIMQKDAGAVEAAKMNTAEALPRKMKDWNYDQATGKKYEKARAAWDKKYGGRWTEASYKKWIRNNASNGGAQHSYDMARNALHTRGLIDYVKKQSKKNGRNEDPLERIQWDIEVYA